MNEQQGIHISEHLSDFEKHMIFEGSSQEDVAYAKVFWNSLCLQPPIESNLFSVDIRQRLKIAKAMRPTQESLNPPTYSKNDEVLQKASLKQRQDEKKRYMEMESESYVFASVFYMDPLAQRRDVIIALLRKQREERIKKEMISLQNKPRRSKPTERLSLKTPGEILDQNIVDVQELK